MTDYTKRYIAYTAMIAVIAVAIATAVVLVNLNNPPSQDEMDKRYQECLAAGGSFKKDDVDWSCDVPTQ
jgi:hypothetical protein